MNAATLQHYQQENRRLRAENEKLLEENVALRSYLTVLEELYQATQEITSKDNLFELLNVILYSAMRVIRAEDGSLLLRDERSGELEFVLVHSQIQQELIGHRIPEDEGVAGWVARNKSPLIVNRPRQDPRFSDSVDSAFNFSTSGLVAVPMMTGDKLMGVIELLNKEDHTDFNNTDTLLLLILGQAAATALEEIRRHLEGDSAAE